MQWPTDKNTKQINHTMANRKKHEGEKPYNGQQKKKNIERNHAMVNRKKTTHTPHKQKIDRSELH